MTQLASEKEGKLAYLKRELVKRVCHSRFFDSRCHYGAPKSKMPAGVKKLIAEIEELEKKE